MVKKAEKITEKLMDCICSEFDKGIQNVNTAEMGMVVDMLKDMADALYHLTTVDAMNEYSEDAEERYYTEKSRKRARMPEYDMSVEDYRDYEPMRDMDRRRGRMYYTEPMNENMGNGNRDAREGKSGMSRKGYMESKELHNSGSEADKMRNRQELEKWIDDIGTDVKSALGEMSPEERTVMRQKLTNLSNAI